VNTSGAPGKVRARSVIVVARSQIGSALTAGKGSNFSSFTFFAVGAALFIVERYLNGFFEMSFENCVRLPPLLKGPGAYYCDSTAGARTASCEE
jgi:hypothetical protein